MEELLSLKPDDLRSVRLANDLEKRSSSWPYSWSKRFIVLSANFVFVFGSSKVSCILSLDTQRLYYNCPNELNPFSTTFSTPFTFL
jgi:hypothetical protein